MTNNLMPRMAERLRNMKGKFLLALNDCKEIRNIFSGFDMERAEASYSLSRNVDARGKRGELIISN